MKICGIQKLTLLDYPGKVACTLFTCGCNLRCPFCQNSSLVLPELYPKPLDTSEVLAFLSKRTKVLEGVAITGGETCLQKDIHSFIQAIKDMGFSVKLDTNGTFPQVLEKLLEDGLLDYVAMDIKGSEEEYEVLAGTKVNMENIQKSISLIMSSGVDYEFRTTAVKGLHRKESFEGIRKLIIGAKNYYLQNYDDQGEILGNYLGDKRVFLPFSDEELECFASIIPGTKIRGKD